MTGHDGADLTPSLTARDIADSVPDLVDIADVTTTTFRNVPGSQLGLDDIIELATHLRSLEEDASDIDGIVVAQGTDTLEEVAFAIDVLGPARLPVVFTGAMRSPSQLGSDAAANVVNAVRIAANPDAMGTVLVTFDDVIHAARLVRKLHASRPSAFGSPAAGPVGWIAEDRVRLPLQPPRSPSVAPEELRRPLPHVALLRCVLGDHGRLIAAVPELDYEGLVIEAFGVGHVPAAFLEPLSQVTEAIPVVFTSATGAGEVFRKTYSWPGSEQDLIELGAIPAPGLDGPKARLLLSIGIAAGWTGRELAEAFERCGVR